MNAMDWSEFAGLAAAGALGLLCLFEGTRRLVAGNAEAPGGRRFLIGLTIVGLLAGYAYWQHRTYAQVAAEYRGAEVPRELPADWGKKLSPAKREAASQEAVRGAFVGSGVIRQYFDASGQRKAFAPAQDDIKRREGVVALTARLQHRADEQFKAFVFWLVLGASALVFGFGFAIEPARPAEVPETDTRVEPTLPVALAPKPVVAAATSPAVAAPAAPPPAAKPAVGIVTTPLAKPAVGEDTVPLPKPSADEDTVPIPKPKAVGEDTVPLPKPPPGAFIPPKKS